MKICVLGLGYIGLPSASMFATHGYNVLGVDVRKDVVEKLNRGEIHIDEPGLAILVEAAVRSGKLKAVLKPEPADAFIIAVPTPSTKEHKADMTYVENATRSILPCLRKGNLVILESTSPPRTCLDLICPILEKSGLKAGKDFYVAHSPERLLPGRILKELIDNDRIIGGINVDSAEKARDLYLAFAQGEILLTDATTAEMTKLVENTFRDVNIALANELSRICDKIKISVWDVLNMANRHPRVHLHKPGPGVGGHCIAVDPWFIVDIAPEESRLIRIAREINDSQPEYFIKQIETIMAKHGPGPMAFFGLTYKPDVDDIRESPSFPIVKHFMNKGCNMMIYDPYVSPSGFPIARSFIEAVNSARYLVFIVGHKEFIRNDFSAKGKIIIDAGNILSEHEIDPDVLRYTLGSGSIRDASKP